MATTIRYMRFAESNKLILLDYDSFERVYERKILIMADFDFNAPYVDRRTWIIDHLQDLVLEPKEILVVLLIDFFNQQHISIDHELINEKLKISVDEVEDIFTELSDKGYLTLDYANGSFIFNIEGIFELSKASDTSIDRSLLEQFEMEFGVHCLQRKCKELLIWPVCMMSVV